MKHLFTPFALLLLALSACAPGIKDIPETAFNTKPLEKWNAPFSGIWVDSSLKEYKVTAQKIYVAPATLDYITPPLADDEERQDVQKLADFYNNELKKNLSLKEQQHLKIVDSAKKADFILETAFVKVKPTKKYLNWLSFGTSLFVPYVSMAISPLATGEMAMVARLKSAKTGKVVVAFADIRDDEPSLFGSLRDYTSYGHHYQTADMWADKMSDVLSSKPGTKIKAPLWFTLSPF